MNKKLISTLALAIILLVPTTKANAQNKSVILEQELKGANRYETSGLIADKQNYTTAIIVNSDDTLADGLSASGLSGAIDAPILLTHKDSLPNETMKRLNCVKKVYIIGGINAISNNVENQIKSKGISIERLEGDDRIKTSYAVAKEISEIKGIKELYFANGYKGEADAMSIGSVASSKGNPIILTNGNSIPFHAGTTINYVVGGTSVVSDKLVMDTNSFRLSGKDRFETNNKVNEHFYPNADEYILTKGWNLVDALTSSSLGKPIVFVEKGKDKSILKGASSLIRVGGIATDVYQECIDAIANNNPNQVPVLTVDNVTINVKDNFNNGMLNISAIDKEDGNISSSAVVTGSVNTNKVGTYKLTIVSTDSKGATVSKEATVTVKATNPVVNGSNVTITQGEAFNNAMLKATGTDCEGKSLNVVITGNVDVNTPGTYNMTLKVTDEWNLTATKTVVVTVEKKVISGITDPNSSEFKSMVASQMYSLVNSHRAANGLPAYNTLGRLEGMANAWSKHMADTNQFDHVINGKDASETFPQFGEAGLENIALGALQIKDIYTQEDANLLANRLFNMWKNSEGHNAAMISSRNKSIGFGFYVTSSGTVYATQEFYGLDTRAVEETTEVEAPPVVEETPDAPPVVEEAPIAPPVVEETPEVEAPKVDIEDAPIVEMN